jgi:hypothetical protein
MCRSFVKDGNSGNSAMVEEGPNVRLLEAVRIPDGESLSDSNARIVMTWASMIDPAMILSDVFRLSRLLGFSARGNSADKLLVSGNRLGNALNGASVDDALLLSEPLGVPALERLCTTRTLSLLSCLTETCRALSERFPCTEVERASSSSTVPTAARCEGS